MGRLRMAVIGVGHLGKEHARILACLPDVELVGVADVNAEQARAVAGRLGVQAFGDWWPLLNLVDAASIVVPTVLHRDVACEFLRRGIPVLVEKPLAPTLRQAEELVGLADRHNIILQVGHIERFNPAFEEITRSSLRPKFVRAERLGPFTGRSFDIGVVLDLMIHDLDLILTLVQAVVVKVEALGVSVYGGHEDVANARLAFANGCVADVTASRASAQPRRRMHLWGAEGYAALDFGQRQVTLVQPSRELRERGLDPSRLDPASRARIREDLFGRHLETVTRSCPAQDQLTCELQDFVHCVKTRTAPRVTGQAGRDAIELAEKILAALRLHSWTGADEGPRGPANFPVSGNLLFPHFADNQNAA